MAMRRPPGPPPPPGAQAATPSTQVFKPRDTVYKFQRFFPVILGGLLLALLAGGGGAYALRTWLPMWWMIPLFMAFPAFSIAGGAIYANRLTQSRIVIDQERMRIMQGSQCQANLPWSQITRLTVRREREDDVYEVWVRNQPVTLPAAFFEDQDKLLQVVSARTRRPWERAKPKA
jgi:hypothetical protein